MTPVIELAQAWARPRAPRPVVIIGAGGIVENAHLPAYRAIGVPVRGLYDLDGARASELAARFGIARSYGTLAEAVAEPGALFDVAVPARAVPSVIAALPRRSAVLIQKPMGETLAEARAIAARCERSELVAAVNFQLRYSPNMLALSAAIRAGLLGELVDVEVRVNTYTPWHLWPFLKGLARHEILYHSIHYLDLIRSLLGEPRGVLCKVLRHPALPEYADTRSATILDYGETCRVVVSVNHAHDYGAEHAMSELKIEGSEGAAVVRMGVNLDYPRGLPDTLELARRGGRFEDVPLRGSWFPCAFEGTMSNLQRFVAGDDAELHTRVSDALKTMSLVEACYASSAAGGTQISG